jgi:hypothetical protein
LIKSLREPPEGRQDEAHTHTFLRGKRCGQNPRGTIAEAFSASAAFLLSMPGRKAFEWDPSSSVKAQLLASLTVLISNRQIMKVFELAKAF